MKQYILFLLALATTTFCSCFSSTKNKDLAAATQLSHENTEAGSVSFTSDEQGLPLVSWSETSKDDQKSFYLAWYDKEKKSFSNAIAIPVEQNTNLHVEGMPKIALKSDGTILAVYETSAPTEKNRFAGFVKYIQSFDKGRNWTKPQYLHADTSAGKGHSFASIARLSDGEIGACWLDVPVDAARKGRSLKFARTNGKNGFIDEKIIDSMACQCCRTAISADKNGNISIMFRDIIADSIRDISLIRSTDNGRHFSKAVPFTNDGWIINGCPHNGPSVLNEDGFTYAAWFTGGDKSGVYYASIDKGSMVVERKLISRNARNIQLCLLPGGKKILAYNETVKVADSFYSKITVKKIEGDNVFTADLTTGKAKAAYPMLYALGKDQVLVAWVENGRVYCNSIHEKQINKTPVEMNITYLLPEKDKRKVKLAVYTDPVCGMPVKDGVNDTTLKNGKVFGFCNKNCKEKFMLSDTRK